jgi:hypothetical protein
MEELYICTTKSRAPDPLCSSSHGGFGIRLVLEKIFERAPWRIDRASPKASQLHPISRSSSSSPPSWRKLSQKHTTDARCGRARRTAAAPGRNREATTVLGREAAWTEAAPGNESRGLGSAEKEATQTTVTPWKEAAARSRGCSEWVHLGEHNVVGGEGRVLCKVSAVRCTAQMGSRRWKRSEKRKNEP